MSSKPSEWIATGPGWGSFAWSPDAPRLDGDEALVEEVRAYMATHDYVAVTPTGPFVRCDEGDPVAVLAVLREVAPGPVWVSSSAPSVPTVPDGAVA